MPLPKVRDHMVSAAELHTLSPDVDIYDAVEFLLKHRISGAPVTDGEKLVGIISEKDCLKLLTEGGVGADIPRGTVEQYMTRKVVSIPSKMDIYYAAGIFLRNHFRRMPIVDDDKLMGQISRRDILSAVQEKLTEERKASEGR